MTGAAVDQRPTPYHRLGRENPEYQGWRLPVGLITGFGLYLFVTIGGALVTIGVVLSADLSTFEADLLEIEALDARQPVLLGLLLLSVAIWLPCQLLGRFLCGPRFGDLMSVEGHLRWRWLAVCSAIAAVVYAAAIGVAAWLDDDPSPVRVDGTVWAVVAVSLLVVPLQATAEEVVFRGQLMQTVGAWTRFAWLPVLVSTPLFVAGHAYEWWGLVDVGVFGLLAAYLTIRTGGLEAAIAAHTANNVVLLILDSAGVWRASTTDSPTALDVVPTIVCSLVMAGLVEVAFRMSGLRRTRPRLPDPPPKPVFPAYPYPGTWGPAPPHWTPMPQQWAPAPQQAWPQQQPWVQPAPQPVAARPFDANRYPAYPGEISETWPT